MRYGIVKATLAGVLALCWTASAAAQQVRFFPDFSSVQYLQNSGSAHQATYNSAKVLRLTDGYPGVGATHPETSSSWFVVPSSVDVNLGRQVLTSGFDTYFKFQIHTAAICCAPADGLAFVIQNSSTTALGSGNGGLGYSGIPNSVAVEFDTHLDTANADPSNNHVGVQSCGTAANSADHSSSCAVAGTLTSNIPHLGVTCGTSGPCTDGTPHEAVIEYNPPASGTGNGTLLVWIDQPFIPGTHTPCPNNTTPGCPIAAVAAISVPYNFDINQNPQGIALTAGGSAWVGFTASQTSDPQAHDILAWTFTPHAPTQVTQVIPNGGITADYIFGVHDMSVTQPTSYTNNGPDKDLMTVTATPVARNVFYQRLLGSNFISEQCITYLETGGNCIVYTVTCQKQSNPTVNVPCPASNTCSRQNLPACIAFTTSFTTSDTVTATNADYLKCDPGGHNPPCSGTAWSTIFLSYNPQIFDGKTSGAGGSSSDFVATYHPRK